MTSPPRRIRQADQVIGELVDERIVLLDADGRELITLNPVGTVVWTFLAEERDVDAIVEHLGTQFPEVARAQITSDVVDFVAELDGAGLITSGRG